MTDLCYYEEHNSSSFIRLIFFFLYYSVPYSLYRSRADNKVSIKRTISAYYEHKKCVSYKSDCKEDILLSIDQIYLYTKNRHDDNNIKPK